MSSRRRSDEQDLLPFAGAAAGSVLDAATRETVRVAVEAAAAEFRMRIAAMLDQICVSKRPCKACHRGVWFTRNKSGAIGVWDSDGRSHFATCTEPVRFSRKRGGVS